MGSSRSIRNRSFALPRSATAHIKGQRYCRGVTNRYDQSDLNIYGAEDDFEMDAILNALDKASETSAPGHSEPVGYEWSRLLSAPRRPAGSLLRAELPEGPGVYFWSLASAPEYVGTATSLRKRLWSHLGGGVSLAGSSLRRNVCELLFKIPPNVTSNPAGQKVTAEQATAIREWLLGCDVSWLESPTQEEAAALETRLRRAFLPSLNRV